MLRGSLRSHLSMRAAGVVPPKLQSSITPPTLSSRKLHPELPDLIQIKATCPSQWQSSRRRESTLANFCWPMPRVVTAMTLGETNNELCFRNCDGGRGGFPRAARGGLRSR